jgi:riboflavin kinase/FMN adenylyltransferase
MNLLFRDARDRALCPDGSVVCIGAFDGLHLGHRALVGRAVERARALGVPAVALSFEPLPREFFARDAKPPRLMLPRAKVEGLRELGCEGVGLLRFDAKLAAMPAEDFVRQVLVRQLSAREVWVGPEFRFGKGRAGDIALLRAMGAELAASRQGFTAHEIEPVHVDGERVSSTRIRAALTAGDFAQAARLLGRPYAIGGHVVRGQQLGRTLGFPTANLRYGGKTPALRGIYATLVHGIAEAPWPSVSSFGTRPTVDGVEPLLEAHLFDFAGDLYGRRIVVEFVAHLRDEEKFPDLPSLVAQMRRDEAQARAILQQREPQRCAFVPEPEPAHPCADFPRKASTKQASA